MGAVYGREVVTSIVQPEVSSSGSLTISASDSVFTDSWKGHEKSLVVVYQHQGYDPRTVVTMEGQTLHVSPRNPGCNQNPKYPLSYLNILGAAYGLADVTHQVQQMVQNGSLTVVASNSVFGDAWCKVEKTLTVVYQYGTEPYQTEFVTEGETLSISPP